MIDSAAPGTDLALHKTATASTVDEPGHEAANVTDGDREDAMVVGVRGRPVDPGGPRRVGLLRPGRPRLGAGVRQDATSCRSPPTATTWTDAESVDNSAVPLPFQNADASLQSVDLGARTARYVRINWR